MFSPKVFAGSAIGVLVLLYLGLFQAHHVDILTSKFSSEPAAAVSPLEAVWEEFMDMIGRQAGDHLSSWARFDEQVCPHHSEFFSGMVNWFEGTAEWHIRDWWGRTLEVYFEKVLNNEQAPPGYLRSKRAHDMLNAERRMGINLEFANQNAEQKAKFQRPPIDTPSVSPHQVTIMCGSDASQGLGLEMVLQGIEQRQEYADHFGNKFQFYNLSQWRVDKNVEHPVWLKLPLIEHTFSSDPECEWIWWVDTDAVIMNGNFNLTRDLLSPAALEQVALRDFPVFEEWDQYARLMRTPKEIDTNKIDFIVSQDMNGINMGSFLIHRSQIINELLQVWGDPLQMRNKGGEASHARREQDAFTRLYTDLHYLRERTAIVSSTLLNSYVFECQNRYLSGDTLLHFAGRSDREDLGEEWANALRLRTRPGDPEPEDLGWGTFEAADA